MSRELDEACARAMGTHPLDPFRYSTDPAHIPEMLAWLMRLQGARVVHVTVLSDLVYATMSYESTASELDHSGATIQEALARLVVEVARAKEKNQ